jgi:ubiquinone/menaquinone biosynthesis C-methylase UbiE
MTRDLYEDFAERYDLSFGQLDQPDPLTVEFFRKLFTTHAVNTVLDCACGTARHLRLFHSLGCEVSGSDLSESMLAQARKNLTEHGIEALLRQADYRDLPRHFQRQFDAVVCIGSIGYMPNDKEYLSAFESMGQVLRQGGILVLTAIPTDRQWKQKPRFMLTANTRDFSRLFVVDYLEQTARYNILDVFHGDQVGELKVWSAELSVRLRDDLERLLQAAGFHTVDFYGAFDFAPYDKEQSNHLIAVAHM